MPIFGIAKDGHRGMKIAVIGSRGLQAEYGSIDRVLAELCPRLARRGHRIDLFCDKAGGEAAPADGVTLIGLPGFAGRQVDSLSRAAVATAMCLWRNYDIIHFCAEESALFSPLAKAGLSRIVVTLSGEETPGPGLARRTAEAAAAYFADRITVMSRSLEARVRLAYGREPVFIPNGITLKTERPDPAPLARFGLQPGGYVFFASRLVRENGCHDLIEAFGAIASDKKLVIAGGGRGIDPYRRSLRQMADPERVVFTGPVGGKTLDALFGHAYLVTLPSHGGPPAPALLEAIGHRKAILLSDTPEHVEITGGQGFTFTVGCPGDLKRMLSWLLNDPAVVAAMEERVAATAARFCWDRVADSYERLFASLL